MSLRVKQVINLSPEINQVLKEMQKTPSTSRISRHKVNNLGNIQIPMHNGTTDPNEPHIKFSITMAQTRSILEECDMGYCQFFVEHLERAALSLILVRKSKLDMLQDASCHLK